MTATCTNAGVWITDPAGVVCKNITGMHRPIYLKALNCKLTLGEIAMHISYKTRKSYEIEAEDQSQGFIQDFVLGEGNIL